jgi:hypothetical protein
MVANLTQTEHIRGTHMVANLTLSKWWLQHS